MARELLLLRHGKSDWDVDVSDFQRPIKDRGKRGAQRVGVWLSQQDLIPDLVISSPAVRALTTAEKCIKAMGHDATLVGQDERLYLASRQQLTHVMADCPKDSQRIMLVGHNPGLDQLIWFLADEDPPIPRDGKLMPTATLARLELPDDWRNLKEGQGRLLDLVRGADLPEKFPFPGPEEEELRDRPAYYYTQSSVIPYRIENGQIEVMVVRSSKNKHWVVPKGIAEPGHSLQDSAAKEAWEEAGVEGEVIQEPLGSYSYSKWGADCTVTVYPMRVDHVLPEHEWEESHRGRRWVTAGDASAMLKQRQLSPLVKQLEIKLLEQ